MCVNTCGRFCNVVISNSLTISVYLYVVKATFYSQLFIPMTFSFCGVIHRQMPFM